MWSSFLKKAESARDAYRPSVKLACLRPQRLVLRPRDINKQSWKARNSKCGFLHSTPEKSEQAETLTRLQVKTDAALVWENCRLYNSRPSDEPVRDMCTEVEQEFRKLWAKAGLEPQKPRGEKESAQPAESRTEDLESDEVDLPYTQIQEDSVPEQYSVFQGTP